MTHPNIAPTITVELPPLALDILINALGAYIDEIAHVDPDRSLKMECTLAELLEEVRSDFRRRVAAGETM